MILTNNVIGAKLQNKDFVSEGELKEFSGVLQLESEEWFLITDTSKYELHFGPSEFLKEQNVELTENDSINGTGYFFKKNIAVVNFVYNEKIISLRADNGDSLWRNTKFAKKNTHTVDEKICIGCGLCVSVCPVEAISMENGKAKIDKELCISCGICEVGNNQNYSGCPVGAISKGE